MKLRYLHLPRCGPLQDVAMVFGQENVVFDSIRKGAINFVVGVNGTGKSSILRTIYQTFQALRSRQSPALPLTIAWDRVRGGEKVTAILRYTNEPTGQSLFALLPPIANLQGPGEWEQVLKTLNPNEIDSSRLVVGTEVFRSSLVTAHLPDRLIAYTSGAEDLWTSIDHPHLHPIEDDADALLLDDERPQGWSLYREWEEEQPIRITNIIARELQSRERQTETKRDIDPLDQVDPAILSRLVDEFLPLNEILSKLRTNQASTTDTFDETYFRVQNRDLRLAGLTVALWQSAQESSSGRVKTKPNPSVGVMSRSHKSFRRILNEIDWLHATHLSVSYKEIEDRATKRQLQELLSLNALADEVVSQPRGRRRAIISLGRRKQVGLEEKLRDIYPFGLPSKALEDISKRVRGCSTGAEAVIRVFSENQQLSSTPLDVFRRLRQWDRSGILEDITLTLCRINRKPVIDEAEETVVVTYDQLSDGEQMLLCRMAIVFLLSQQDGSLLLLDEPDTHFNDVWKREIVDIVDEGLLRTTEANVLVATHTSIALTDAFAAEVTVLDKDSGTIHARTVSGGLLGTDPGEIAVNLFKADSSIGSRALEYLEKLLSIDWKADQANELESILKTLGSSYHRAELRAVLNHLRTANDVSPSN